MYKAQGSLGACMHQKGLSWSMFILECHDDRLTRPSAVMNPKKLIRRVSP